MVIGPRPYTTGSRGHGGAQRAARRPHRRKAKATWLRAPERDAQSRAFSGAPPQAGAGRMLTSASQRRIQQRVPNSARCLPRGAGWPARDAKVVKSTTPARAANAVFGQCRCNRSEGVGPNPPTDDVS